MAGFVHFQIFCYKISERVLIRKGFHDERRYRMRRED